MPVRIDVKSNAPTPNKQVHLASPDLADKWLAVQEQVHKGLRYNVRRVKSRLIADHPDTGIHIEMTATIISSDEFIEAVS